MKFGAPEENFWLVKAASVAGSAHRRTNQPCQDAHYWQQLPKGWLVAAVADGAGTAPLSDQGACAAASAAVSWLAGQFDRFPAPNKEHLWGALLREAMDKARLFLAAQATALEVNLPELATTLTLLAISPQQAAAIQVGDGAIVVAGTDRQPVALTVPRRGEYCNETLFLHSPGALEHAQIHIWDGKPKFVAMMTDGLQSIALHQPDAVPHPPFFDPLWLFASLPIRAPHCDDRLAEFLESDRLAERVDDDLTLLLACWTSSLA